MSGVDTDGQEDMKHICGITLAEEKVRVEDEGKVYFFLLQVFSSFARA